VGVSPVVVVLALEPDDAGEQSGGAEGAAVRRFAELGSGGWVRGVSVVGLLVIAAFEFQIERIEIYGLDGQEEDHDGEACSEEQASRASRQEAGQEAGEKAGRGAAVSAERSVERQRAARRPGAYWRFRLGSSSRLGGWARELGASLCTRG
jgi:hypothetical protein